MAPTYDINAEIFSVGKWNGDDYTKADLQAMVDNFTKLKDEVKPPVKLGHNDKQLKDGQPAMGWVESLSLKGDKLIARLSGVPELIYTAIKQGLYKRVSSEIYWNYKKGEEKFSRVLAGVALLGADIPAVSNLADLQAFLSQSASNDGLFDSMKVYDFAMDEGATLKQGGEGNMEKTEAEIKKEYDLKLAAATSETEKEKIRADKAESDLKAYKVKEEESKKTSTIAEVKAFCEEQVKAFKMTPASRDIIVKGLDEGKHVYSSETATLSLPFVIFKEYMEKQGKLIGEEMGGDGKRKQYATAGAEVDAKAKEYKDKNKVNYSIAMNAVLTADADLAKRFGEETGKVGE